MYLIVGLGNPEQDYSKTRHNMGFNVINLLAKKYNININKNKFKGLYGLGQIEEEKVILVKPQTYMNLSGECIREIMDFYKIDISKLIVIYDDIDIKPGAIKVKKMGGPGTHNGMKSVIQCLKEQKFTRVRVGIGTPENKSNLINYVLGAIDEEDKVYLNEGINKAKDAVIEIIKSNVDIAMNKFN